MTGLCRVKAASPSGQSCAFLGRGRRLQRIGGAGCLSETLERDNSLFTWVGELFTKTPAVIVTSKNTDGFTSGDRQLIGKRRNEGPFDNRDVAGWWGRGCTSERNGAGKIGRGISRRSEDVARRLLGVALWGLIGGLCVATVSGLGIVANGRGGVCGEGRPGRKGLVGGALARHELIVTGWSDRGRSRFFEWLDDGCVPVASPATSGDTNLANHKEYDHKSNDSSNSADNANDRWRNTTTSSVVSAGTAQIRRPRWNWGGLGS